MTNNSNLSPQAAAALEAHRKKGGQFGAHANTNPEAALPAQPAEPITSTLTRQTWDHRDRQVWLGEETFDARPVLDSMTVDVIAEDAGYNDEVFHIAAEAGVLATHDGPFEVHIDEDELEEYLQARRDAGQEEPITRRLRMTNGQVDSKLMQLGLEREAISQQVYEAGRTGVANIILGRFPEATEAAIYNSLADDGETLFEVETITGPGDEVLWAESGDADDDDFMEALREYSVCLDRKGDDVLSTGIEF